MGKHRSNKLVTKQNAHIAEGSKVKFGERTLDMTGFKSKLVEQGEQKKIALSPFALILEGNTAILIIGKLSQLRVRIQTSMNTSGFTHMLWGLETSY